MPPIRNTLKQFINELIPANVQIKTNLNKLN